MRELPTHGAAFAVALGRFIADRVEHGERVTRLAAQNIAAMAAVIQIRPTLSLEELGFELEGDVVIALSSDAYERACKRLDETGDGDLADRILLMLSELTVADVENYQEPQRLEPLI